MPFETAGFERLACGRPSKLPLVLVLSGDAALWRRGGASLARRCQAGRHCHEGAEAGRHQEHQAHAHQVGDGADNQ